MRNKPTVYFVTGLAGVGKSSYVEPMMLAKKENLLVLPTDNLRLPSRLNDHLENVLKIRREVKDRGGFGGFEGVGAFGFIKYHSLFSREKNILISTTAFNEAGVIQDLEKSQPEINVKAAFIICSSVSRREKYCASQEIIDESKVAQSNIWRKEIESLNLENYKYFDLIDSVPAQERNNKPIFLKEEYVRENARKIVEEFFLI